jgi:DNA repair exonuclease SbcCD ATPase subunit
MSDIQSRALAAAISREREASRDWSKAAKEYRKRIAELEKCVEHRQDILEIQEARIEELEAENQRLKNVYAEIRNTAAHYMVSQGCGCCEGAEHGDYEDALCGLLEFPRHKDDSGFDYYKVSKEALLGGGENEV